MSEVDRDWSELRDIHPGWEVEETLGLMVSTSTHPAAGNPWRGAATSDRVDDTSITRALTMRICWRRSLSVRVKPLPSGRWLKRWSSFATETRKGGHE